MIIQHDNGSKNFMPFCFMCLFTQSKKMPTEDLTCTQIGKSELHYAGLVITFPQDRVEVQNY